MPRTTILAYDRAVEVNTPEDRPLHHLAARYTTMAVAAAVAKGAAISNVPGYVESVHTRACRAPATELRPQMARWAAATRQRHELLAPVCALMLCGQRIEDGTLVRISGDIPSEVADAAAALFGHDIENCDRRACEVCRLIREGDWPRALRAAAGVDHDVAAAALVDGYRAARKGGLVPAVQPVAGDDGSLFAAAGGRAGSPHYSPDDVF